MVAAIQGALRTHQPNLHLHIQPDGHSQILGSFVVWSDEHKELDRYQIEIRLLGRYPKKLPVVKEIGDRIPRIDDRHVNHDGTACVLIPEDRGRCFPVGAPFENYLNDPLRDFFLSQTWYEQHGEWPFDQWSHGAVGIVQYYRDLTGAMDIDAIVRYVRVLSYQKLKGHLLCPCASGQSLRSCCHEKIIGLRIMTEPGLAKRSLRTLESVRRRA